jgi:tetratricopeptide (TPR) repeat protein
MTRGTAPGAAAAAAQAALDLVPADPRRAAAEAELALRLARRERDPAARSLAFRALGLATQDLGDLDAALSAVNSAVRVAESAGLASQAAQARMSRAYIWQARGHIPNALRDADAAVSGLQGLDRARALAQQALILQRADQLDRAHAAYGAALPTLRRYGDRLWEARLRDNRAHLHALRGHLGRAKADITQAADLHGAMRNARGVARTRLHRGVIEGMHGNIPAALAAIDRAAEEYRKGGWRVAIPLMEKCEVLLSAGLAAEALATACAAVAELSDQKAADLADAQLLLARAQLAAGSPGPARDSATAARGGFTRQRRPGWAAVARYIEAHAAWAAGEQSEALLRSARKAALELDGVGWPTAALDLRLLAARIATGLGRLEVARNELQTAARARGSVQLERRVRAWHALALLRTQAGNRRGAYAAVSAGLSAAEQVRLLLGATELRVMVASHVSELAELGLWLAIEDGAAGRVLWSAERYRAATVRIRPVLPPADESLAALRAQLRAAATEAERTRLAGRPIHAVIRRQHALEEELRRRLRHHQGEAAAPAPVAGRSASSLVSSLAACLGEAMLVEYVRYGDTLHAVVIAGSGARRNDPPAGSGRSRGRRPSLHDLGPVAPLLAELDSLRFAWRRLLTGHGSPSSLEAAATLATHAAEQLDRALLRPLERLLGDCPLVVVPPGPLRSLPWLALPSCASRPVTVAPSAASWLAARPDEAAGTAAGPSARPRVALIAGPGLPGAAAEVGSLAPLYPGAQVLAGQRATVTDALQALEGTDVAHIAAHGEFRADNPMFSSITLADGPLTVYDLERLRQAPKTIMLTACDTGRTQAHPGDEMTGLASALLAVGASSVVAPLLPLPDQVAARLAHGWHTRLRAGDAPARALSATRADVGRGGQLPLLAGSALVCLGYGG